MTRAGRALVVTLVVLTGAVGVHSFGHVKAASAAPQYYDPSAVEGSIYRLYRAYFLREPDAAGFAYWYLAVAKGTSLDRVSDVFAASSEFRTRYGSLDDAHFVALVYQNVLGRSADPSGRVFWVGRMRAGLSRGRVMRYFSESSEYQRETGTGVPAGWRAGANAGKLLATLRVAAEPARVGYSIDLFPHWDDEDHDGCDTRCEVMANEKRRDGTWFSWWDAKLVSTSGYLAVDQVVDPAEAWDSGASHWGPVKRQAFSNWQDNLVVVGRKIDASKGDQDAGRWSPPRTRSNCLFAEITVTTKAHWNLSVDPTEKARLSRLLDGCRATTSDPPPVTRPPAAPRHVMLYGDSLSMETAPFYKWFMGQHGYETVAHVWGGTAPCDWFDHMRDDWKNYQPVVAVVEFSGAAITPCMKGRDILQAYREDARTATRIFIDQGIPVVWVSTPLPRDPTASLVQVQLNQIEEDAATELGETFIDAGASVLDHGRFSRTLPCLSSETRAEGCIDGRIVVRSPDGAHLCPTQKNFPCPMYSSGALRYGNAQADAGLRRIGAKRSIPAKPG
jgi:hypothetical protein